MPKITATTRLFLRTRAAIDLDGWRVWTFPEVNPGPGIQGRSLAQLRDLEGSGTREWQIRESPSGVRLGTLKVHDAAWPSQPPIAPDRGRSPDEICDPVKRHVRDAFEDLSEKGLTRPAR